MSTLQDSVYSNKSNSDKSNFRHQPLVQYQPQHTNPDAQPFIPSLYKTVITEICDQTAEKYRDDIASIQKHAIDTDKLRKKGFRLQRSEAANNKKEILQELADVKEKILPGLDKAEILQQLATDKAEILQQLATDKAEMLQQLATDKAEILQQLATDKAEMLQQSGERQQAKVKAEILQQLATDKAEILRVLTTSIDARHTQTTVLTSRLSPTITGYLNFSKVQKTLQFLIRIFSFKRRKLDDTHTTTNLAPHNAKHSHLEYTAINYSLLFYLLLLTVYIYTPLHLYNTLFREPANQLVMQVNSTPLSGIVSNESIIVAGYHLEHGVTNDSGLLWSLWDDDKVISSPVSIGDDDEVVSSPVSIGDDVEVISSLKDTPIEDTLVTLQEEPNSKIFLPLKYVLTQGISRVTRVCHSVKGVWAKLYYSVSLKVGSLLALTEQ